MKFKLYFFCPYNKEVINKVIRAASDAGAGIIGNYSQCAFITKGQGHWKSETGSKPHIGKVGEVTTANEVRIEMECPEKVANAVSNAIKRVHPYDEVVIDFVRLESV